MISVFKEGTIAISKGFPPREVSLDSLYKGWSVRASENDTSFAVTFTLKQDTVVYTFYRLDKPDWADDPAMTYTLTKNGSLLHWWSDSMPGIFLRPRMRGATDEGH